MIAKESKEGKQKNRIQEALLRNRKILISGAINSTLANQVIKELLFLNDQDSKKPISIFINSPGGEIYSGFAIFDIMRSIEPLIKTIIIGFAASMGSIISLAADPGYRYALPNAMIMIHQPLLSGVYKGRASDIEIQAKEMINTKDRIIKIYADATGKEYSLIQGDINRDLWISSTEAMEYGSKGLVDKVIYKLSELD